jgi:hypothetical protein
MGNHSTQILSAQKVLSCLIRVRVRDTGWIQHTNSFERSRRKGSKHFENQKPQREKGLRQNFLTKITSQKYAQPQIASRNSAISIKLLSLRHHP